MMHLTGNLNEHVKDLRIPSILMVAALFITIFQQLDALLWWGAAICLITMTALWCYKKMPDQMRGYLGKARRALVR
jgi:hypothetical protein